MVGISYLRNNLLRKLAGTTWSKNNRIGHSLLNIRILLLVVDQQHTHTQKVDTQLNEAFRIGTYTADIAPTEIRRKYASKSLSSPNIPIHLDMSMSHVSKLKSYKLESNFEIREFLESGMGRIWYPKLIVRFGHAYTSSSDEFSLLRRIWCNLNRTQRYAVQVENDRRCQLRLWCTIPNDQPYGDGMSNLEVRWRWK